MTEGYPFDGSPYEPHQVAFFEGPNGVEDTQIVWGDFNGDGQATDLMMLGFESGLHFYDRLTDQIGTGAVAPDDVIPIPSTRAANAGDMDGDGVDDVMVLRTVEDRNVELYSTATLRSGGDGLLLRVNIGSGGAHFAAGDLDGDGQSDVAFLSTPTSGPASLGVYLSSRAP